jgi:hypothetical protein
VKLAVDYLNGGVTLGVDRGAARAGGGGGPPPGPPGRAVGAGGCHRRSRRGHSCAAPPALTLRLNRTPRWGYAAAAWQQTRGVRTTRRGGSACTRDALGTRPEAARLTVGGRSPTSTARAGDERCHPDRSSSGARRARIRRGTTNGSPNPLPSLMTTNPVLLMVESDGRHCSTRSSAKWGCTVAAASASTRALPLKKTGRRSGVGACAITSSRSGSSRSARRIRLCRTVPPSPTGTASGGRSAPGRWSSSCSPRRSPPAFAGSGAAARSAPSP